jgi:hypothetical protein
MWRAACAASAESTSESAWPKTAHDPGIALPLQDSAFAYTLRVAGEAIATIVVAVCGTLGVIVQTFRNRGRPSWHATVREELELMKLLPDGNAQEQLQKYIDHKIFERTQAAMVRRRDNFSIGLGLTFLLIAGAVAVGAFSLGGWWNLLLIVAALIGIFGLVGFSMGVKKVERDEKGNAVTGPPTGVPQSDPARISAT